MNKRNLILFMIVFCIFTGASMAKGEDDKWVTKKPYGFNKEIWIRIVDWDEPWEKVVKEVQERFPSQYASGDLRLGFYGHGGLISPEEAVANDSEFVAGLGLAADMDVMIFPKLEFPEKNVLQEIPQETLKNQLKSPLKTPIQTTIETATDKALGLASENLYATAHAAKRLTEGISTFHNSGMTPFYAGFSNGAEVIVKVGQILKEGKIWDGRKHIPVSEDVRNGVYFKSILTFAYLFPKGDVTDELLQRVEGEFTNVVPQDFWKRWGNFRFSDKVNNFKLENAPSHGKWPHLKNPEDLNRVHILGSFLEGEKHSNLNLDGKVDLPPLQDEKKEYVPWDDGGGGGGGGRAIGTPRSPSLPQSPKPLNVQSGVAVIRQSLEVEDKSIPVNPELAIVRDAAVGACPSGQVVCEYVPLP